MLTNLICPRRENKREGTTVSDETKAKTKIDLGQNPSEKQAVLLQNISEMQKKKKKRTKK